jgi:hypothetical protein
MEDDDKGNLHLTCAAFDDAVREAVGLSASVPPSPMNADFGANAEYASPDGQVWVCGACGKASRNRMIVGDESCFLNAVLCYAEKDADGNWQAVKRGEP